MISDRPQVNSCHSCAAVPVRPQPQPSKTRSDPLGPPSDPIQTLSGPPQGPLPGLSQKSGIYTTKSGIWSAKKTLINLKFGIPVKHPHCAYDELEKAWKEYHEMRAQKDALHDALIAMKG